MAQTLERLKAEGYRLMECTFTERCVIGQPCERAWRQVRWHVNPETDRAFREAENGRLRSAEARQDARWKHRSNGLSIFTPMREGVSSHLTVFHNGAAILSVQYGSGMGSGQFQRGTCVTTPGGERK